MQRRIIAVGILVFGILAAFATRRNVPAPAVSVATRPAIEGVRTDQVRVSVDSVANVIELAVGPVALPAGLPGLRIPIQLAQLPLHGWLRGFSWEIRDTHGRVYSRDLLHHFNLIDPDQRELFSPVARRIVAFGRETEGQKLPPFVGYPVQPHTRVMLVTMFANPGHESIDSAYLHIRLDFTPHKRVVQPLSIVPFHLDVTGPVGEKDFPVPPGTTVKAWEGSPAVDARILALGGHVHDYATVLRLEDLTERRILWEADLAEQDGRVHGVSRSMAWKKGGIPIYAGHRYRALVEYENPTGRPAVHGGMGVIGGIVLAPDRFPAFDRRNFDYTTDLANVISAPTRSQGGHGHGAH